jgi:hypothetical protein
MKLRLNALAVVKKLKGKLNVLDIYSLKDLKDIRITKDEKIIKVEIKEC